MRYTDEVTEAVHSQLRIFEERHKLNRIDIADKVMLTRVVRRQKKGAKKGAS